MMKIPVLLVLTALPLAVLHAEEGKVAAPAAEAANPSSEELRKTLLATAKEEMEIYNKKEGNSPDDLGSFFDILEKQSPETFVSGSGDANYLRTSFPAGPGFAKSKELTKAYLAQLTKESTELRQKYEAECISAVAALVKRATETQEPEKLAQLSQELDEFYSKVHAASRLDHQGGRRIPEFSADQSSIQNFFFQITRFHNQRMEQQWGNAASNLQELQKQDLRLSRYLPADAAKAFIANCEKSIGILPPEESKRLLETTLAELFDDKNQDRLEAIQGTIRKQVELFRNTPRSVLSQKWQHLSELASSFSQNVTQMKQGSPSQFSPEQWFRSNSNAVPIIGREKLIELMKRYQVRVMEGSVQVREEPIYYDIKEVIARIQSPADIARELPVFHKAMKQLSYSSDSGNWQNLGQRLQQYGDLFAKLESGVTFTIGSFGQSDVGFDRSNNPGVEDAASKKSAELNQQLQWMIVQRFCPEVVVDPNTKPAQVVADRFAQAKKGGNYQEMLTLGKLSAHLTPGQGLLTPQDGLAIQCYLDGVKQEEQLDQPRLATYYFQRAAAVPNSPIPPSIFKARLKSLKRNAPKDYEKGTDDALAKNLDSSGMGMQSPLMMVPEKPAPAKAEREVP